MRSKGRVKHKGRREGGAFTAIPHAVQDSENWKRCGGTAIKLLCVLARQFNGGNNGDLCAARKVVGPHGFSSPETLLWALRELQHYRLIVQTRQGGLGIGPSLYALTWHAIDECNGKLDCAATSAPPGDWKQAVTILFKRTPRKLKQEDRAPSTEIVTVQYGNRIDMSKKAA
ncbi:hypothetical protein [Solimonas aquatica]|uniref:hypothetical protein n=1 Tax=Solimonas aquatica TaxID=489703 RepID=UPI000B81E04E|nr:hypothetical protein [Solimonas aquatica]